MNLKSNFSVKEKLQKYLPPLNKPHQEFIIKAVEGVLKSGTVMMTEIGRKCRGEIKSASSLKYVKRNLENKMWSDEDVYKHDWNQINSKFVKPTSVISIDFGDITKPYAKKMEGLAEVWDGSQKTTGTGYTTIEIVGITEKGKQKPLLLYPFSTHEEDFLSQNRVVEEWLNKLFATIGNKGIIVSDRGFLWPAYIRILSQYAKHLV